MAETLKDKKKLKVRVNSFLNKYVFKKRELPRKETRDTRNYDD